ncbi:MAG: hypothetical protein LBL82_00555 [Oscillospiraceae bacterium]|nr:hypothetical protein [Oscillospiraceae bacterium]
MRKYIYIGICIVLSAALIGLSCYALITADFSNEGRSVSEYQKVLRNEKPFLAVSDKKEMLLSDWFEEHFYYFEEHFYYEDDEILFSFIDMDGDGVSEAVVAGSPSYASYNNPVYPCKLIFHFENNKVYGYELNSLYDIYEDGTVRCTISESDNQSYETHARLIFGETDVQYTEFAKNVNHTDSDGYKTEYFIGGKSSDEEEYDAYMSELKSKEIDDWYTLNRNGLIPRWQRNIDFDEFERQGIDLRSILENYPNIKSFEDVDVETYTANFSKRGDIGYNDDLCVLLNISNEWYKANHSTLLFYEGNRDEFGEKKYNLIYSESVPPVTYIHMIDLNGDFIDEILYETTVYGQRTQIDVNLLTKKAGYFTNIFKEGIYLNNTYYYDNDYSFVKGDSNWYDIVFDCTLYNDEWMMSIDYENIRGTTIYSYNGESYEPKGEEFEYARDNLSPSDYSPEGQG